MQDQGNAVAVAPSDVGARIKPGDGGYDAIGVGFTHAKPQRQAQQSVTVSGGHVIAAVQTTEALPGCPAAPGTAAGTRHGRWRMGCRPDGSRVFFPGAPARCQRRTTNLGIG